MQLYPGWSARDNYGYGSKKKKRKKDRSPAELGGTTERAPAVAAACSLLPQAPAPTNTGVCLPQSPTNAPPRPSLCVECPRVCVCVCPRWLCARKAALISRIRVLCTQSSSERKLYPPRPETILVCYMSRRTKTRAEQVLRGTSRLAILIQQELNCVEQRRRPLMAAVFLARGYTRSQPQQSTVEVHFSLLFPYIAACVRTVQWHALGREEQAKYYELARRERQLHMQLYPDWSSRANTQRGKKRKRKQETTDGGTAFTPSTSVPPSLHSPTHTPPLPSCRPRVAHMSRAAGGRYSLRLITKMRSINEGLSRRRWLLPPLPSAPVLPHTSLR